MKRTRLRPISKKQRKMQNDNQNWRADFIVDMNDKCMLCGGKMFDRNAERTIHNLSVHEILRGKDRPKSYEKRELCLVLCDGIGKCCHPIVQDWPLADQLALKREKDPNNFSLQAVRQAKENGRHPRVIEMGEVIEAGKGLGFDTTGWSE